MADLQRRLEEIQRSSQPGGPAPSTPEEARRLREAARDLLERSTPEQRRAMEDAARQWGGSGGSSPGSGERGVPTIGQGEGPKTRSAPPAPRPGEGPTRVESVDARRSPTGAPDGREQVVDSWLGEGARGAGVRDPAAAQRILGEAARSAHQAVEERAVPARYRGLIERYFRRLPADLGAPVGNAPDGAPGAAPLPVIPAPDDRGPARNGGARGGGGGAR